MVSGEDFGAGEGGAEGLAVVAVAVSGVFGFGGVCCDCLLAGYHGVVLGYVDAAVWRDVVVVYVVSYTLVLVLVLICTGGVIVVIVTLTRSRIIELVRRFLSVKVLHRLVLHAGL